MENNFCFTNTSKPYVIKTRRSRNGYPHDIDMKKTIKILNKSDKFSRSYKDEYIVYKIGQYHSRMLGHYSHHYKSHDLDLSIIINIEMIKGLYQDCILDFKGPFLKFKDYLYIDGSTEWGHNAFTVLENRIMTEIFQKELYENDIYDCSCGCCCDNNIKLLEDPNYPKERKMLIYKDIIKTFKEESEKLIKLIENDFDKCITPLNEEGQVIYKHI